MGEGDALPDVRLRNQDGVENRLLDILKERDFLILYFYPRDDTPGCTKEACGFRDSIAQIRRLGAEVVGVSVDPPKSHRKFIEKYSLPFQLLSDEQGKLAEIVGAYSEERKRCIRKTYIIDKTGKIIKVYNKVNPEVHAEEVMQYLNSHKKR